MYGKYRRIFFRDEIGRIVGRDCCLGVKGYQTRQYQQEWRIFVLLYLNATLSKSDQKYTAPEKSVGSANPTPFWGRISFKRVPVPPGAPAAPGGLV